MLYKTTEANSNRYSAPRVPTIIAVLLLALAAITGISRTSEAQLHLQVSEQDKPADWTLPPRHAIVTSASGGDAYTRYTPFSCGAANTRAWVFHGGARTLTWRDRWLPTPETVKDDSIATQAVRKASASVVRACLARFTPENIPARELWGLGTAWLNIDEYERAAAAFSYLLRTMKDAPVTERAGVLRRLVALYAADPIPVRRTAALAYMQQLDTLGAPAAGYRLAAHNALFDAADAMDSVPFMAEQGRIAIGLARAIKGDIQREWIDEAMIAFRHHADLDGRRGNFTAAMDTLTAAVVDFGTEFPGPVSTQIHPQVFKMNQYGKPVHPIEADYVYLPGKREPLPSIDGPTAGKVTIILTANHHFLMERDVPKYTLVHKLIEKFGSNLSVIMILSTTGDFDRRFLTPDEEAPVIRDYVQQYLKLPITTAVWKRPTIGKRPDGQILYGPNPNIGGEFILIDKQKRLRNLDAGSDQRMLHMVEELIREP